MFCVLRMVAVSDWHIVRIYYLCQNAQNIGAAWYSYREYEKGDNSLALHIKYQCSACIIDLQHMDETGGKCMNGNTYGYVRVSSRDQNEARQMRAMAEQQIPKSHIFMDKQSGKDFDRPQYKRVLRRLKKGDLLIVHSIDRLGRNYDEILEQWRIITKEKQADICVLDFPLLDTRSRIGDGDLTGRFVSDLVLQILAYVAQKERESIRQRQAEGIAAAKARNVHFGRRAMQRPSEFGEYRQQWKRGEISAREAAKHLNISHNTFLRWSREEM